MKRVQRAIEEEAKKCPPGTKKMPEEERVAMLDELKSTKATLEKELEKFPLSMKTVAIQRKRDDMV